MPKRSPVPVGDYVTIREEITQGYLGAQDPRLHDFAEFIVMLHWGPGKSSEMPLITFRQRDPSGIVHPYPVIFEQAMSYAHRLGGLLKVKVRHRKFRVDGHRIETMTEEFDRLILHPK